ncbi:ABC transporter substrate-binding protein [Paenibacillus solani]|uniref:ABC transporter substrate-binding protein n=1 Tax=Paenibacillus solani TaxID=1705565 RepID=A0A0M1P2E2_9BACL|nr:extracellular solute-binding protein [Paenibacillus solani]KOR88562.1 ABC transporter substrate-binding protein [Paenibacillus solani]
MKRLIAGSMTMLMLSLLLLTGCGSKNEGASSGERSEGAVKEFEMSLRHTFINEADQSRVAMLNDVIKEVENQIPGLKIVTEGVDVVVNRSTKLKAEFAAGSPPKIFYNFGGSDTESFAKTGHLLDLTPIVEELGLKDKIQDFSEFTVDGKIYGIPDNGYIEGFFYNKKIFNELGLTPPTTWDQFLAMCETLKSAGYTPLALGAAEAWSINMIPTNFAATLGGIDMFRNLRTGETRWTDPEMVKAFEKVKELMDKGYYTENTLGYKHSEAQAQFSSGKAAIIFDGTWGLNTYANEDRSVVANDLGFFKVPNFGEKGDNTINASFSTGYAFSSHLDENEMKAVKAFIKEYYQEKWQKRQLIDSNRFPSMVLTDTEDVKPIIKEISDAAQGMATFPAYDALVQPKIKSDLESGMQQVVGNKITVQQMLETMQQNQEKENKKD